MHPNAGRLGDRFFPYYFNVVAQAYCQNGQIKIPSEEELANIRNEAKIMRGTAILIAFCVFAGGFFCYKLAADGDYIPAVLLGLVIPVIVPIVRNRFIVARNLEKFCHPNRWVFTNEQQLRAEIERVALTGTMPTATQFLQRLIEERA